MSLAKQIKPISFLKDSTADAVRTVRETGEAEICRGETVSLRETTDKLGQQIDK